jgi:hypothetical protein
VTILKDAIKETRRQYDRRVCEAETRRVAERSRKLLEYTRILDNTKNELTQYILDDIKQGVCERILSAPLKHFIDSRFVDDIAVWLNENKVIVGEITTYYNYDSSGCGTDYRESVTTTITYPVRTGSTAHGWYK